MSLPNQRLLIAGGLAVAGIVTLVVIVFRHNRPKPSESCAEDLPVESSSASKETPIVSNTIARSNSSTKVEPDSVSRQLIFDSPAPVAVASDSTTSTPTENRTNGEASNAVVEPKELNVIPVIEPTPTSSTVLASSMGQTSLEPAPATKKSESSSKRPSTRRPSRRQKSNNKKDDTGAVSSEDEGAVLVETPSTDLTTSSMSGVLVDSPPASETVHATKHEVVNTPSTDLTTSSISVVLVHSPPATETVQATNHEVVNTPSTDLTTSSMSVILVDSPPVTETVQAAKHEVVNTPEIIVNTPENMVVTPERTVGNPQSGMSSEGNKNKKHRSRHKKKPAAAATVATESSALKDSAVTNASADNLETSGVIVDMPTSGDSNEGTKAADTPDVAAVARAKTHRRKPRHTPKSGAAAAAVKELSASKSDAPKQRRRRHNKPKEHV